MLWFVIGFYVTFSVVFGVVNSIAYFIHVDYTMKTWKIIRDGILTFAYFCTWQLLLWDTVFLIYSQGKSSMSIVGARKKL